MIADALVEYAAERLRAGAAEDDVRRELTARGVAPPLAESAVALARNADHRRGSSPLALLGVFVGVLALILPALRLALGLSVLPSLPAAVIGTVGLFILAGRLLASRRRG